MPARVKRVAVLLVAAAVLLAGAPAYAYADGYTTYENTDVCFSVEYPVGYDVSEPYSNAVLITDGDGYSFAVEYVYQTLGAGAAVYSAADFAAMLDADPNMMADWVGVDSLTVDAVGQGELGGIPCYAFDYSYQSGEHDYTGTLALFDSQGGYGCYCVTGQGDMNSPNFATYSEQAVYMANSFRITGAYHPAAYTRYTFDGTDGPIDFLLTDTDGDVTQRDNGNICIYPIDGVYSQANIVIHRTVFEEDSYTPEEAMEGLCHYYLANKDNAAYVNDLQAFSGDRYDMYLRAVQYDDEGESECTIEVIFPYNGVYWEIYATATEGYEDEVGNAMECVVGSLRLGGEPAVGDDPVTGKAEAPDTSSDASSGLSGETAGPGLSLSGEDDASAPAVRTWSVNDEIDQIVASTKAVPGYFESESMPPLASATDVDQDGVWEFLELYETKNASTGAVTVRYAAWALQEGGPVLLASDKLYLEAGGNRGTIGLGFRNGICHLMAGTSCAESDGSQESWVCIPWQGAVLGTDVLTMAADESSTGEGSTYTVNGASVSQIEYESAQLSVTEMFHMDLVEGHGNGNVMTLDVADEWDFDL